MDARAQLSTLYVSKPAEKEFQQRAHRLEELVQSIESIPDPKAQALAKELVQALLDLHGTGLERTLEIIDQSGPSGVKLIDTLAKDELVSALLLLHGLHPLSLHERVTQALEKVRPYMLTHGGNVEFLGVTDDGVVKLRLEGSCHSCPSSRVTLKYAVEEAIYALAPDVTAVEAEGVAEAQPARIPGFVPLTDLTMMPARPNGDGWISVQGLNSLREGSLRVTQVSDLPVLFCRVDGNLYAYGNVCPNCHQLLGQAKLAGKDLICATCGHTYDVMRAGRDLDSAQLYLEPYPLLEENGQVRLALPVLQNL